MLEVTIGMMLSVILFIIFKAMNVSDNSIGYILEAIPVIIPTFLLWENTPKNYLKLMSLKSFNIIYDLTIRLDSCNLDEEKYRTIKKNLIKDGNSKIFSEDLGKYIYKTVLKVDSATLELDYSVDNEELLIHTNSKEKYKSFFYTIDDLFSKINNTFANEDMNYRSLKISLKIIFENTKNEKKQFKNPFWRKLLKEFNNKQVVSLKYKTNNNSIVDISNNKIEFLSDGLRELEKDINSELRFFKFRN